MRELFIASKMVAEDRSVNVIEMADRSIAIEGVTVFPGGDVKSGAVRLSSEAMEQVRQMLNKWHECNKEV